MNVFKHFSVGAATAIMLVATAAEATAWQMPVKWHGAGIRSTFALKAKAWSLFFHSAGLLTQSTWPSSGRGSAWGRTLICRSRDSRRCAS